MTTILIVDDDPNMRELLRFYLQRDGYKPVEAADGEEALGILENEHVLLAIVDIMMPNMDGYELCQKVRADYDIPVLMLTAKRGIADKEKAFVAGTDDYVIKPFEPKEVLFRIKALLRRFQMTNEELIRIGNTTINRNSHKVEANGTAVILPLKEFELLAQLASYPDRTFSRKQLIGFVWGNDYTGKEQTVDVHVKRLRKRFTEEEYGFEIQTIRGLGYKLVERTDAGDK